VTGVTTLNVGLGPKWLELLHQILPAATNIAVLVNPSSPAIAQAFLQALRPAANTFRQQLHILEASTERDIDEAFAKLSQVRADALVITPDTFFSSRAEQLGALGVRYTVPTVFEFKPFTAAGGLLSYGGSETDNYRLVGNYTGPTGDKSGADHQPQDRQEARHHRAAIGAKPRRRGDRIELNVRYWHKADIPSCTAHAGVKRTWRVQCRMPALCPLLAASPKANK
jgi:hypothetical protein